ncbi:nuclear transport factor 2 family protein [Sphingobacterium thalpophilum]|uniref:Nuclear transport factor 2 family protein n=1 Tax=Sphingobacterium thalpophilum TaxID=259 RepID=A0A4U9VXE3_9SPHI|nr:MULTISPECIES: nuclear transport factor 2 family protein [Sphingobacterium]MCW8311148.1 nuclear transport factor 2 family protein [Sphingobacterium sp. InxBP1]VTR48421.1 Uncharacterised protein [Sphingobacterium thalpophilum]
MAILKETINKKVLEPIHMVYITLLSSAFYGYRTSGKAPRAVGGNIRNMKKTLVLLLLIWAGISAVHATSKSSPLRTWNAVSVIGAYVNTISIGDVQWVEHLFTDDFDYHLDKTKQRYSKKQFVKFLKSMADHSYDCVTEFALLDETPVACMAKMTLQFETFTRTDYIYMLSTAEGWKISKILVSHAQKDKHA